MTVRALGVGDVVVARLPAQNPSGHEQEGYRPAVIVGVPAQAGTPRFPMLVVAPLTTDRQQAWATAAPALYPALAAGTGGLPADSIVLADQVRALDATRIARQIGTLKTTEYAGIQQALKAMFSL